jgi:hypothetical protein
MKKRRRKRMPRCVCGQPITHPPIPPGTPWPGQENVPSEVVAAGHTAHAPNDYCQCAVCNSLR